FERRQAARLLDRDDVRGQRRLLAVVGRLQPSGRPAGPRAPGGSQFRSATCRARALQTAGLAAWISTTWSAAAAALSAQSMQVTATGRPTSVAAAMTCSRRRVIGITATPHTLQDFSLHMAKICGGARILAS